MREEDGEKQTVDSLLRIVSVEPLDTNFSWTAQPFAAPEGEATACNFISMAD